tara:strand:+ start:6366 stop:6743 length:378 start_codon:yes stop_codon:yes gene_type:complete
VNVEKFLPKHYEEICGWWKAHDWTPVSLDALPCTGVIVPGVCAGFLYSTDSSMCILEWIISNPKVDSGLRSEGLDIVIDELLKKAHSSGYKTVFTSVSHPKLLERYCDFGFKKADFNMTNLLKVL